MLSRADLEAKPNWQATFRVTRRNSFECLMRDIKGGFYWHTPDYGGQFAAGATVIFGAESILDALHTGLMELAGGALPPCLAIEPPQPPDGFRIVPAAYFWAYMWETVGIMPHLGAPYVTTWEDWTHTVYAWSSPGWRNPGGLKQYALSPEALRKLTPCD